MLPAILNARGPTVDRRTMGASADIAVIGIEAPD